jgi:hypothetical protein
VVGFGIGVVFLARVWGFEDSHSRAGGNRFWGKIGLVVVCVSLIHCFVSLWLSLSHSRGCTAFSDKMRLKAEMR